jgi:hypothetical protein
MRRLTLLMVSLSLCLAAVRTQAITVGQGPVIGVDKRGTVWYQEFQDWSSNDVRVVSPNNDEYILNDGYDTSRDLIAFYSHDGGATGSGGDGNYYFRADSFDLQLGAENGNLDVYVLINCASGGTTTLPDSVQGTTDHGWNIAVAMYDTFNAQIYNSSLTGLGTNNFVASDSPGGGNSYWNSQLDAVEFGINRQVLLNAGWNGTSPIQFWVFTTKDFNHTLIDTCNSYNRSTFVLSGAVTSTNTIRTAKYAAVAHANQSLAPRTETESHIYTAVPSLNLYPGYIRTLDTHTMLNVPLNMHISGTLLSSFLWAREDPNDPNYVYPIRDGPTFLQDVKNFIQSGNGALIGGVYSESIMPYFEGPVNQSSMAAFNDLAQTIFGLTTNDMKVMHVPERVIHSNTNWPHANPSGPLTGKPFQDILAAGYQATYLDEISHLHWWFYPNETNSFGNCCATGNELWAGFGGCNWRDYQHKIHKINGVYCFMINDREDGAKFGPQDNGMANDTRYCLLFQALEANSTNDPGGYAQISLVFDDWEAYAGNCFTCTEPNNNADQWHETIRWAANHQWIQICKLKDVLTWAQSDTNWVVDHGNVYNDSIQTYEWLKRASEQDYDHWYYGWSPTTNLEESFFARIPATGNNSTYYVPGTKNYGDLNTTNTLIHDSWAKVQAMPAGNLQTLAKWEYSAMIYETAWHDENAPPWWGTTNGDWDTTYHSRNYQSTFDVNDGCTTAYSDQWHNNTSSWAIQLHGHVRSVGILADAEQWVQDINNNVQGSNTVTVTKDVDDGLWNEYILKNNRVYLCFKRWGGRLVAGFVYNPTTQDATEVIGQPVADPANESDEEDADNNRCSAFKDRYATTPVNNTQYVDMDYGLTVAQGSNYWVFTSQDGQIKKQVTLPNGRDVVEAQYTLGNSVGTLYVRHGLGPNQLDLLHHGDTNLLVQSDNTYYGLSNTLGGAVYAVCDVNCQRTTNSLPNAGFQNREFPLIEQVEQYNAGSTTNFTMWLAFSPGSAVSVDGDGIPNWWRLQYFGHITGSVTDKSRSQDDADGTGQNNLFKYMAGLNPTNPSSVFKINTVQTAPVGGFVVNWSSVPGYIYQVLDGSSPAGPWQNIGGPITASVNQVTMTYTDTTATAISSRFYHVQVDP